jgi:predicted neutral ceramidase superfamily lipid hydrolase
MVWVYDRTDSLLLAVLMHASLAAATFILGPLMMSLATSLIYGLAVAAGMWMVVAAVAVACGGQFSSRPGGPPASCASCPATAAGDHASSAVR